MALQSKTITGNTSSSYWTHKLVATENSTNTSNNTSSVTITAYIGRSSSAGASYMYGASISCTISVTGCNNQTISYSNSGRVDISAGGWLNIGSKTFTVPHNNDGSKTVTISSSFSNNVSPSSGSSSGSMNLTKIARQATITNSPTSFTDEENPWFSFSNPANASMSCWLEPYPSGTHYCVRTLSGTSGTFTWTLTTEERNQLRSALANATNSQATCRIGLYSTIGGTTYASYVDRTLKIVNANPTFEDFEYEDTNTTTLALTGNNQKIIKGYSTLETTISTSNKAEAIKNATMSYYQLLNLRQNYSSSEDVVITATSYEQSTINIQAVDSRGNSTSVVKDISSNFINYSNLVKGSITLERSNNGVGEFVTLTYNGSFWNDTFGNVANTLNASYRYKKTSSNTWITGNTTINPTASSNNYSFSGLIAGDSTNNGFELNDTYDVEVTLSDKLGSIVYTGIIGAGSPAMAFYKNKVSLGDKYDTTLGGIQFWGDVYVNGNRIS